MSTTSPDTRRGSVDVPEAAGAFRERDVRLSGSLDLRVREWVADGPPLLLIHGFLGSRLSWGDLPGRLGGAHAVAVDLPGHGASGGGREPGQVTVPRVARILAELQERVFGRPASWLGYSMGGRIALAAATQGVPMQRLLLESGGPGLATEGERKERRRVDRERAERLRAEGIEAFVDAWLEMPLFRSLSSLPRGDRAAARGVRVSQDASRMAAWLVGAGTGSQPDFRPSLGALDLPVHLLAGSLDAKYVALAREMAESLPRGRVSVVPGAGHAVHLEAPAAWVEWVKTSLGV